MKPAVYIVALFFLFLICISCQSTSKHQDSPEPIEDPYKNFADGLVKEDTVAVTELVTKFMQLAQQEQYAEAAAMLYKLSPEDQWDEPQLLDNNEMNQVKTMLKQISFTQFYISNLKFESALKNEVKCSITLKETGSTAPIQTNICFNPVNYLGGWRLCLKN